jgi:tRNA (guanine-N7-)-methyltransferase
LTVGGELHFKTDNTELFEFSLEELPQHGFELKEVSFDLHKSEFAVDNVQTTYEEHWIRMGYKIHRLVGVWTGK